MSLYSLDIVFNFSIVFAAVFGLARLKYIPKTYHPFILFVLLGCANETISFLFIETQRSNAVNSNIYVLCEYLILLYQFYQWKACHAKKFYFFVWLGISVWVLDNIMINEISDSNSLFRCFACFVIVFFSIDKMNSLIVNVKGQLLHQASFLICAALLLFNGCKAFIEGFHLFHVPFGAPFYSYLWLTLSSLNAISNVIFSIALLCIPTREEFTLPY